MTPHRKNVLREILDPFCLDTADILGREDINNLLAQYEEIERKNFKLWLTSSAVLERVLHVGIFADSEAHLERIRLRLCRYVPNRSFERNQIEDALVFTGVRFFSRSPLLCESRRSLVSLSLSSDQY